jgi:GNAT superfamily N-acetyltransferase
LVSLLLIRPYRAADAPALSALACEMAADLSDPPPALDAAMLERATGGAEPWCELLVAEAGEALLGFVVFTRRFEAHRARFSLWIADLHVASGARRRGVARALMQAVARRATELDCPLIAWDLWLENARARAFYLALGAEVDDALQVLRIAPQRLLQ